MRNDACPSQVRVPATAAESNEPCRLSVAACAPTDSARRSRNFRCGRERMPVRRSAISAALVIGAVAADGEQAHGVALYLLLAAVTGRRLHRALVLRRPRRGQRRRGGRRALRRTHVARAPPARDRRRGPRQHARRRRRSGARRLDGRRGARAARPPARRLDFVAPLSCPSGERADAAPPRTCKTFGWNVWRGSCSAAGRPWSGSGSPSRSSACSRLRRSRTAGSSRSRSRATRRTRRTSGR